jgi:hypothetical protein
VFFFISLIFSRRERWHCILAFIPDRGCVSLVFCVSAYSLWHRGWLLFPGMVEGYTTISTRTFLPRSLSLVLWDSCLFISSFFRLLYHSVSMPAHTKQGAANGFGRGMLLTARGAALPHPSCLSSLLPFSVDWDLFFHLFASAPSIVYIITVLFNTVSYCPHVPSLHSLPLYNNFNESDYTT